MEREPDIQSLPLSPLAGLIPVGSRVRLALLCLVMLMPWVWVGLGLHVFRDYRLAIVLYELLGCGLPVLLFCGRQTPPVFPLRLERRWLFFALLIVNGTILGAFWITQGFGMDWGVFYQRMESTRLFADVQFWAFALYIVIVNPIFEELFWRGVVYREWRHYINPRSAKLISSFFFGAWHWLVLQTYCEPVWAIALTLAVMIGGVLFASAYEKTGTLASSIALHGLGADLPMVFIVYDCTQRASSWAKLSALG